MAKKWQVTATVPHSEVEHFNPRGLIDSDQLTATFYQADIEGGAREVKGVLATRENKLTDEGVQDFSLQATPSVER